MNPYDFVPVDFTRRIERRAPAGHDRFSGLTGEIGCSITAESPIFIKGGNLGGLSQPIKNLTNEYIVPASSLKGIFRSLVETVGHGCFGGKFDGSYRDAVRGQVNHSSRMPKDFKVCPSPHNPAELPRLCIACRLFGWLSSDQVYTGNVFFSDAICPREQAVDHSPVYTVDLMSPKPHHAAFYLSGNCIAGRKYYFHFPQGIVTQNKKTEYNEHMKPLGIGTVFHFTVKFTNIDAADLPYLLYALVLEEDMRHKIGYAKPSGFGSVHTGINYLKICTSVDRYLKSGKGATELDRAKHRAALDKYIKGEIKAIKADPSPTMQKLREILRWQPGNSTTYRYPTYSWFRDSKNTNLPISHTP